MCAIDYADPCDVWNETRVIARRPNGCCECGRRIATGEEYVRVKALYDGRWDSWATCRHCSAASQWLRTVCGGYLSEGLIEEMVEHWEEGYRSVGMGRLIVGMQRRWREGADEAPDVEQVRELAERMMLTKVGSR